MRAVSSEHEKAVGSDHLCVLVNTWWGPIPGLDNQRAQFRAVSSDVPHHGVRDPVALQSQMLKMRALGEDRQHIVVAYAIVRDNAKAGHRARDRVTAYGGQVKRDGRMLTILLLEVQERLAQSQLAPGRVATAHQEACF